MHRWSPLNKRQFALLGRLASSAEPEPSWDPSDWRSAYALRDRGLVTIKRGGGEVHTQVTDAGAFYIQHGHHPDDPAQAQDKKITRGQDQFLAPTSDPDVDRPHALAVQKTISQVGIESARSGPGSGPRPRYTYPEAAEILRVKERWPRENVKRLPHSKKGVTVTFSEADLDSIDAMFHHQPVVPVAPTFPPGAHPLAGLKPIGSRRRR